MYMRLSRDYRIFDVAGQPLLLYTGGKSVDVNAAFALNQSSAWLINKAGSQDFSEDLLVAWLLEEYEVGRDEAEADVKTLVELLREHHIVQD